MKMMRWDAYLESNYEGPLENLGFENWTNSSTKYITGDSQTGSDGWKVSSYGRGAGYVSRNTNSHSGSYSLMINTTQGDHLYFYRNLHLEEGKELKCKNLIILNNDLEKEEYVEWFGDKGRIKFIPLWKWLVGGAR
jgi:hypothetical protein